ncbi:MAG: dihydroorotase [Clostridiales bacterium]|nr:dihydroorotase [Clostridiales bacterium]
MLYRKQTLLQNDLMIRQGKLFPLLSPPEGSEASVLSLSGKVVIPGFADVHVHLREPGFSYKETILSGTRAAARGGYTDVCAMPNLSPPPDSMEHLDKERKLILRDACINVVPYACITKGQQGNELVDFRALAPYVAGFSDDGRGVQSASAMRGAMEQVKKTGKLIAAHCEDDSLLTGGFIHDGEYCRRHGHKGISSKSEWRQLERDLKLAKETGCKYHMCHVSTKESVALIRRAKAEGADVSCETAPHYLLLCDEDLRDDGRFKMNPPIRARADREALIEGLLDGTVDMIATDHAPHTDAEKAGGLKGSLMGVVGLECAFAALHTGLVKTGILALEKLLELMIDNPRKRFGLPERTLEAGQPADLAVLDLDREWVIKPAEFLSKGHATPFDGMKVTGDCILTMMGGEIVWKSKAANW